MQSLPQRSIIKKLAVILEFASKTRDVTPKELSVVIARAKRPEFSFYKFKPGSKSKLDYSKPPAIASKIRFAIALGIMDDECSLGVERKDFGSDARATLLFSEKARDMLKSKKVPLETILEKSKRLLRSDPLELPTSMALYAACKPDGLSYKWFRLCLSILLYEPDGLLGASARRIYLSRTGDHQLPGEIGD